MKKTNLWLTAVFACAALVLVFFTAFADQNSIQISSAEVLPGETGEIEITIDSDTVLGAVGLQLSFDRSLLTLKSISAGDEFAAGFWTGNTGTGKIVWADTQGVDAAGGKVFMRLTFELSGSAEPGTQLKINADYDPNGDICAVSGQELRLSVSAGTITVAQLPTEEETTTAEPETTTAEPEPETTTAEPEPETTTAEPEPETTTAEPEPETTTAEPEPETTTAEPEPETTTAEPEPESTTAEPEAESTTAVPEAETTTAEPEPESTTAAPEAETTTAKPEETTAETPGTDTTKPADKGETDPESPDTGEGGGFAFFLSALLLSGCGVTAMLLVRRRTEE